MINQNRNQQRNNYNDQSLQPHEINQIEKALEKIDSDGEVCLIIRNGKLRFIEIVQNQPFVLNSRQVD
jgi:hypothetical protein